ncbi:putative PIF1 DNA helicase/replication protein A1-like protein [Tanacetum coccineum]|uniref:ATP-dependent DNA helicase n=1 Tax=Tanacetum coccineum TaxID=301880 RepID=A0ABQ4WSX2_9ASTR
MYSLPYLALDVVHAQRCRLRNPHIDFTDEEIQNYTLLEIEFVLNSGNRSLSDYPELPHIDRLILNMAGNRLIVAERMIRLTGKVVLSVASSRIASLLLPGGRTSHSRFRIPIDLNNDSCCAIHVTSDLAELIKVAELIIRDEAPLQHRRAFEAVDHTFWDICKDHVRGGHNKVFGGKVVVLGGDFRQILPVLYKWH